MMTRRTLLMTICSFVIAASPIAAQRAPLTGRDTVAPPPADTTTRYYGPKDPFVAGILSFFVPGVGHGYAGKPGKGWAFFALSVASAAVYWNDCCRNRLDTHHTVVVILPLSIRLADILSSAEDARRWNARRAGRPMPRP